MDFFDHQERARRRTGQLVVLYGLAVLAVIVLVYLVVTIFLFGASMRSPEPHRRQLDFWSAELLFKVGGAVLLVVAGATLFKILELRAGGDAIAKSLGGRRLDHSTRDADERKVLNVVEEMSIASGVPVPEVYLLDREHRINAFAAGLSPQHAVIGVTRGCAKQLTRDELQGVVAHEFSHILNGDMRLNLRLIGVLHGILVIGLVGAMLMRTAAYSGRSSRRDGGGAGLIMLGLALFVIGYVGTFFGSLIKAAVSRQREFLADASAVQFTRQPDGLAGALKKIGGMLGGSRIVHPKAEQFSHMYFGSGVKQFLDLLATHPPLEQRIRRVDPAWDGSYPELLPDDIVEQPARARGLTPEKAKRRARPGPRLQPIDMAAAAVAASAVAQVGRPTQEHVDYARKLLRRIPEPLQESARDPRAARAVAYALLLDPGADVRARQFERLENHAVPAEVELAKSLSDPVRACGPEARLPLIDLMIPALKRQSKAEFEAFRDNVDALVWADRKVDVFEWLMRRVLMHYLEPHYERRQKQVVQYYNLAGVRKECTVLLSALARASSPDADAAEQAFAAGAGRLGQEGLALLPESECDLTQLDRALYALDAVAPVLKRTLLQACGACIAADRKVTVEESELFRGVSDALHCPMPPLLPGQPLA